VVADVGPAAGPGEDRRDRLALDVGVLDAEHSPGPEQQRGPHRQRPDRVQAVGTGEQGQVWVVVARLGRD
jgi:hypothetical protein